MPLRKRGKVAVKGKGNMVTYWVGESSHVRMVPKFRAQSMVNFAGDIVTPSRILTSPPISVNRLATNPLSKHGFKTMGLHVSRNQESKEEAESPKTLTSKPKQKVPRIKRSLRGLVHGEA